VQNGAYFEDLSDEYFLITGNDLHFPNGSTSREGSTLSADSVRNSTDYQDSTLVAFTFITDLTDEALQAACKEFADSMRLYDGETLLSSTHQIFGDKTVGILYPGKALAGKDIWVRVGGGENNVLAAQE
jgi:hypothetical protein